eukprot:Polyplicarium_translucidae@DN425_c0_g1_i1.p1
MGNGESTLAACPGGTFEESGSTVSVVRRSPEEFVKSLAALKTDSRVAVETLESRAKRYLEYLTLTDEHMQKFYHAFLNELELGLVMHERSPLVWKPDMCSFKMLDSCVATLPAGTETGVFYAIDFGGTNLRTVRAKLESGKVEMTQSKCTLASADLSHPKGLMDEKATAREMFDFFATSQKFFMKQNSDLEGDVIQTGFTFSFPCVQRKVDSAELVQWTKGFETGRKTNDKVEGADIALLMNAAYARNEVPSNTAAVANDTVGTLLSAAYELDRQQHPPVLAGLIVGTGFNICYVEENAADYGYKGKIINVESGNFNRELPRCNVDFEVDFAAYSNRGFQLLEKLVAGAYLGEVARRCLLKIFQTEAPPAAWIANSLSAEDVATIMNDKSTNIVVGQKMIQTKWNVHMDQHHLQIVRDICTAVYDRSAYLVAGLVAATAMKTGYLQPAKGGVTVAIDGSLYRMNACYREKMRDYLDVILGKETSSLLHMVVADDGSGKGAAILAAII